jgi:hypothetical protein
MIDVSANHFETNCEKISISAKIVLHSSCTGDLYTKYTKEIK